MAIVLTDFDKIWASTSPLTPYSFSESNYKEGWNFVGATPPARQMWDSYMNFADLKMQYLKDNYAPLDSPALTGTPTAPTQTSTDDSTKIATTEFVHDVADGYLPLAGGTMTEAITESMETPATRSAYIIKYTDITDNVAPAANKQGYGLLFTDKNDIALGGVYRSHQSNGWTSTRLYDTKNGDSVGIFVEHASIDSARPNNDNGINLGNSSYRWKQLFAGTSTISTSDERLKDNIAPISDAVLDAWAEVGWVQYQFKDAVAKKGENARIHTGAIAQRIKSVFEAHNLDAFRYGLLCYDEWDAEAEEKDENGNIVTEAKPAGNLYSLRYEEALCMEAAYQRRRADRLEARIEALERAINYE